MDDLAVPRDVGHDARDLAFIHIGVEVIVEPLEPLARHAGDHVVASGSGASNHSRTGQRGGARVLGVSCSLPVPLDACSVVHARL